MNKKKAQRTHFQKRLLGRFGTYFSGAEIETIISEIKGNRTIHLGKKTNRVSAHGVTVSGILRVVLYDKQRKELITVLPETNPLYEKLKIIGVKA